MDWQGTLISRHVTRQSGRGFMPSRCILATDSVRMRDLACCVRLALRTGYGFTVPFPALASCLRLVPEEQSQIAESTLFLAGKVFLETQ